MTKHRRGFVTYDDVTKKAGVDYSATVSLVSNTHLVAAVADAAREARGAMLDVGCGLKPYLDVFSGGVDVHIGTDWPGSLHGPSGVDVLSDNRLLPFAAGSFDTVLCTEVIEHSPDPRGVMAEMARVMKRGGRLILSAPFCYIVHEEPHDYFRFTSEGLRALAEGVGLDVSYVRPVGGALSVLADLFSKVLAGGGAVGLSKLFQRACLALSGTPGGGKTSFMSSKLCHGHIMVAVKPE